MDIAVIGDDETGLGFGLAGIRRFYALEGLKKGDLEAIIKDCGILIVTEKAHDSLKDDLSRLLEGKSLPLLVEIPDKHGTTRGDVFAQLTKKAIGVELKEKN